MDQELSATLDGESVIRWIPKLTRKEEYLGEKTLNTRARLQESGVEAFPTD